MEPRNFKLYSVNRDFLEVQWPSSVELTFEQTQALGSMSRIPGVRVEAQAVKVPLNTLELPAVKWGFGLFANPDAVARAAREGTISLRAEDMWVPDRKPFQYQADEALNIVQRQKRLLAYDMGLGKSSIAIQAAETIRRRHPSRPVLIVAPLFTRSSWLSELYQTGAIESFKDVACLTSRDLKSTSWNEKAHYIFCHYDVINAWWSQINLRRPIFSIVDEAHWIKNGRAQRSKGTMMCAGISPYCVALTATPMANRPSELWNLLSLLALPFAYGGPLDFRKRYAGAEFNGYGHQDTIPTNVEELQVRIQHLYVRKTAADVGLDLPPLVRKFVEVEPQALTEHNKMTPHDMNKIVRALRTGRVGDETLPLLTLLRKESSELKVATTVEIASNAIEQGEKVVVFTWQRQQAKRIAAVLEKSATKALGKVEGKERVAYISGDIDESSRSELIRKFQEDADVIAIVATLQSLKEGVTLHASRTVILHDLDWVPESLRQAERRVLRIGQSRTCFVYWPLVKRSIDMLFATMLASKISSIEKTLGVSLGDFSSLTALIDNEEDQSWAARMRDWEAF